MKDIKNYRIVKTLQNFWYYHKVPLIIILAVLAAGIYLLSQRGETVSSDYDLAIVSPRGCSDEQLSQIRNVLEQAGTDQNGDGAVTVNVHVYHFALGADGQDMNEIGKLDADLVGKLSGIFFTDDPEAFEASTNGIGKAADAVSVSDITRFSGCGIDDLYLLIRGEADQKYTALLSALSE